MVAMKQVRIYTHAEKIQQYHSICRNLGMSKEDKSAFLSGFGVVSSTELTDDELYEALEHLRNMQQHRNNEANAWRRRVIAAASAYLELIGKFHLGDNGKDWRLNYVKGMACRMAKCESFNTISLERLRNIYYALVNAKKDRVAVDEVVYNIQIELLTT